MKRLLFPCLFLLIAAGVSVTAMAQTGNVKGMVTTKNGDPVPFANITVVGTRLGSAADAGGAYTVTNIPAGQQTLQAQAVGYRRATATVTITAGETVTQNFTLTEDPLGLEGVVVTGTYRPKEKLDATVAISTLTPRELSLANPRSTTEVLRYTPGFTRVESSGGEVNENISIRGILGVEYVMFMEDGVPVFPTMHTFFMNADNLFRLDENIDRVEVVRGGNSALFGSNTPGAIINFINKTGGPEIGGSLKVWTGSQGLARYDFNMNGPIGDDWRFNVGGFYRYDHGERNPGFPGVSGGQFKANITRLLKNGYLRLSTKVISDRNQFILDLPFQNPSDPKYVPGFSDYGSMNTEEGNNISVPIPTGKLQLPLDHGLYTQAMWLTADFGLNFANDWQLQNTAQIMSDYQEWNAIVPFDVKTAADYFASLKYPAGSTYSLVYTNVLDAAGNKTPFNFSANDGLGLVAPGGEWHVEKPISAFQDQVQIKKALGQSTVSLGLYFANYTQTNKWYFTDILTDVRDNPHFLDMIVYSGADTLHVTNNGFRHYLSNYVNGTGTTSVVSGVLGGEIVLTDNLRVDLGVRLESDNYVQAAENTSTVDLDGNPKTPYDAESWGNGSYRHFSRTINDWAGSIGMNYRLSDQWSVYVQGSRAYKMPALDEFLNAAAQNQVDLFEARRTVFVEGGMKFGSPIFGGALTGFWGELTNNIGQGLVVDPATGNSYWQVQVNPDARAYGIEIEASVQPTQGLNVLAAGTFLKSQTLQPGGSSLTAGGIPPAVLNAVASYTVSGITAKVDWHYVGKRDIIDANYDPTLKVYTRYNNVGALPAYNYFNVGLSYAFPGQAVTLSADVLNVTQSLGLEEGNPRLIATGGNPMFLARPILPRVGMLTMRYQF